MTVIGFLIGLLVFLVLGWLFLAALLVPYMWFKAYLKLEEDKERRSREAYRDKLQSLSKGEQEKLDSFPAYKRSERKGIERLTENEIVRELLEWMFSWGVFLAVQALWTFSLYRGFSSIMEVVGEFLDDVFFLE